MRRRSLLHAGAAATLVGCANVAPKRQALAHVVVIGGGFGGATAARYIRLWEPRIDVTLVERESSFVSCPMSNLVIAGLLPMDGITRSYDGLARAGVRRVQDEATAIDVERKQVRLARGEPLAYDRLVIAPGVDMLPDRIPGLTAAEAAGRSQHAWKAGPQTQTLRAQLQAMPDGGVFAIAIPRAPYRCPPGPYERACLVANFFKQHKPRSKVLVLDANPDITSKKALFEAAWAELYPGMVEYRPNSELLEFDNARCLALFQLDDVKADVFNIIPPQQAGRIAQPFINVARQWVGVEYQSFESTAVPGVHVIGDAIAAAPAMPKSAFMANNQAKVVADAVIAQLTGQPVNTAPVLANTCYSFASDREAMHVASVHQWDAVQKTLVTVPGAGGLSSARNVVEAGYARAWAQSIWADTLG